MTKAEFYLKAMLAMTSNPKNVNIEHDKEEDIVTHMLNVEEIQMDAERLLKEAEKSWEGAFDTQSVNGSLSELSDSLKSLDDGGIRAYCVDAD